MNPGRILIGGVLVAAGALSLAGQAGGLDAGEVVWRGWPVIIVALGAMQLLLDPSARLSPLLLVAVGLGLLGITSGVVGGGVLRYGVPVGLVGLGAWVIVGRPTTGSRSLDDDTIHLIVAFATRRAAAHSPSYRGGSASVFFGSGQLDLTDARPVPGGARLGATVLFGNLFIVVPEGWQTVMRGVPILGGWDDTTRQDGVPPDAPVLQVGGLVLFGGLEVRHAERWS